jgi:hypothetical protein
MNQMAQLYRCGARLFQDHLYRAVASTKAEAESLR